MAEKNVFFGPFPNLDSSRVSTEGIRIPNGDGINSIKNWMGPYQRTPKEVARAIRCAGLGVRSVCPVGDFLD